MNVRTGTLISPEKTHIKAKGRGKTKEQPEYNKLTEILLRLKICTIEEIQKNKDAIIDIYKKKYVREKVKKYIGYGVGLVGIFLGVFVL